MGAFEYLSVLISIVLGLGITQLLVGFSRWLERRSSFEAYGPAIAWAGFVLLVQIQSWWSMFGMRQFTSWNFLQFSMVLLQPIVLFLLAVVVFPGPSNPESDLRKYFHEQRRWFFGLLAMLVVISVLKDMVRGTLPVGLNAAFHVIFMAVAVAGFKWSNERVQRVLAYGTLSLFAGYIAILFAEL